MSLVKTLHDSAMEYMDIAEQSKITKDTKSYQEYLKKAYILEKEAALRVPIEKEESYWQSMLIRSAGWLAYECGFYLDAYNLSNWGLAGSPSAYEKESLKILNRKVKTKIKTKQNKENAALHLYGMLASADVEQGQIKLKENKNQQYLLLFASKDLITKTARHLIGEVVEVAASVNEDGMMVLQGIKQPPSNFVYYLIFKADQIYCV